MKKWNALSLLVVFAAFVGCDHANISTKVFEWATKPCAPNGGIKELYCVSFSGCSDDHFNEVLCANGARFQRSDLKDLP